MCPCFFGGIVIGSKVLCPIHDLWPIIRRNTPVGIALFPALKNKGPNRILKTVMRNISIPDSERYTFRGFRRGCLMEISLSGSTLAVMLGPGGWAAAGFRSYLSLQADEEAALRVLLANIENGNESDSDNDGRDALPPPSRLKRGRLDEQGAFSLFLRIDIALSPFNYRYYRWVNASSHPLVVIYQFNWYPTHKMI